MERVEQIAKFMSSTETKKNTFTVFFFFFTSKFTFTSSIPFTSQYYILYTKLGFQLFHFNVAKKVMNIYSFMNEHCVYIRMYTVQSTSTFIYICFFVAFSVIATPFFLHLKVFLRYILLCARCKMWCDTHSSPLSYDIVTVLCFFLYGRNS